MKTKVDVKFRIRPQRVKNATEGLEVQSGGKHLVTMRVVFNSLRMEFSTGYHVNAKNWDQEAGCSVGIDKSDYEINNGLMLILSLFAGIGAYLCNQLFYAEGGSRLTAFSDSFNP